VFLICYVPHCPEPQAQWLPGILKYRTCRDRGLKITVPAVVQSAFSLPSLTMLTTWTPKPIGPSKSEKILPASLFGVKSLFKFHQRSRVVFHTRLYYMLGLLESSAYPNKIFHSGESRNPLIKVLWTPACARVTTPKTFGRPSNLNPMNGA
jgi:hypothetical protein